MRAKRCKAFTARVLAIAGAFKEMGQVQFATTLRNAAPNLFVFLIYPGLDPTNNETERIIHRIIMIR